MIVDPRLMRALGSIFNSLCTIAVETITQDPSGEEIITYVADPLMTGIKCYVEPLTQTEIRRPDQTIVERPFTIALQGYYPRIDVEDHAVVGVTQVHNILAVKHDDTNTITFLDTEIINNADELSD
jgi:hypothetical protein